MVSLRARGRARGRAQRRLGQNFLRDPNLLEAIVRDSEVGGDDVVLEVGGGEGALSERLAPVVSHLWIVEVDRRLAPELGAVAAGVGVARRKVEVLWGDAMEVELSALTPPPTAVVSNLPYSIATPLLLRTIEELREVRSWTVLVQREIADRLRAGPGSRTYGAPSVLVQLACEVRVLRTVDRSVFDPPPRVDSALLRLERRGPAASGDVRRLVRGAFAHRRKALARSIEHVEPGTRERALKALEAVGLEADVRAESLSPEDFVRLAEEMRRDGGGG